MIYILHGNNIEASDKYFKSILSKFNNWQKVYVSATPDLEANLNSIDLLPQPKVIIAENIFKGKINPKLFENLPTDRAVIIWEKSEIPAATLKLYQKAAKIENFKLPSSLFYFLDSIYPKSANVLANLQKLNESETSLFWQISNRFLLLSMAKLGFSQYEAGSASNRQMADWQWQKIQTQAALFQKDTLNRLFSSSLTVDSLIKTGKTALPPKTLVSLMLVKYLEL